VRLDTLRRPEYTGSRRCWPCTILNLGLVGLASLVLARRNRQLSARAAAVGVAAVALRGYVVPYTPTLAPKLLALSPLPTDSFGPHGATAERPSLAGTDLDGETVYRRLVAAGAVEVSGETVRPADDVEAAWHDEMDRLAALPLETLAVEADDLAPASATAYEDGDGEWLLVDGGELVARPVAVAELAAARALGGVVEETELRLAGAGAFPMFLERCPVCESELAESSTVSCCGGHTGPRETPSDVLHCPTCRQRVYTFPAE